MLSLLTLPAYAQDGQTVVMWGNTPLVIDQGAKSQKRGRGETLTLPAPRIIVDDAPPPKRAPPRKEVDMVSLAAPFGLIEAAAAPPRPRYTPVFTPPAPPRPAVKPGAKPAAPEDGTFTISFRRLSIDVLDALPRWQNAKLPVSLGPNLALFLQAVSLTAQKTPHARVTLTAYANRDSQSIARQISLMRALAVYQWLVDQGVRPTQIDWYAEGIPIAGAPDRVDISIEARP